MLRIGTNCALSRLFLTGAIAVSFPSIIYHPSCLFSPFLAFAKVPEAETSVHHVLMGAGGGGGGGGVLGGGGGGGGGEEVWERAERNTTLPGPAVTVLDYVSFCS